jgi:membrane protein CcdC involved in cytochrome C biogenesis
MRECPLLSSYVMLAVVPFNIASLIGSIIGAIAVLIWRVRETRTPVSARKIIIPPLGMATGFGMFIVPAFRVPWTWAAIAFLAGALALAYPLLVTTRLIRDGGTVMMQRSNAFFAVIILLAGIRLGARGYLDHVLSIEKTAALFFILAFGMIVRWRVQMYRQYRLLLDADASALGTFAPRKPVT